MVFSRPFWQRDAQVRPLKGPQVEQQSLEVTEEGRVLRLALSFPRRPTWFALDIRSNKGIRQASLNGVEIKAGNKRLVCFYSGDTRGELSLKLVSAEGDSIDLNVIDGSYDLPDLPSLTPVPMEKRMINAYTGYTTSYQYASYVRKSFKKL